MVRYSSEQALRMAGLLTVSEFHLTEALVKGDKYLPKVLLMEHTSGNIARMEQIEKAWPQIKVLVIGEPGYEDYQKKAWLFIPRPVNNYALLIQTIKSVIFDNGSDKVMNCD